MDCGSAVDQESTSPSGKVSYDVFLFSRLDLQKSGFPITCSGCGIELDQTQEQVNSLGSQVVGCFELVCLI